MPRRDDLETILVLGSGPIKIGQAAEFDFSGSQAVQALREDGYRVILVNSNPATIQNDPEMADVVYIEPLLPDTVARILEKERPCALLAGMGGQTALNIASELSHNGTLERLNVELIGSDLDAIDKAEDRELFNQVCESIQLPISQAVACHTIDEVIAAAELIGSWPILIRPAFTLGGLGGGTARDIGELVEISDAEKQAIVDQWNTPEVDNRTYAEKRREAYGSWGSQLDMQYHDSVTGSRTWLDHVEAVKEAYPK